jgi:NADH-quinone oxidoreductase subunit L
VLEFINSGALRVDWALRVDTLTAVMLVVVTSVSSLVHLYSWGYMEEDPSQPASSPICRCSALRC